MFELLEEHIDVCKHKLSFELPYLLSFLIDYKNKQYIRCCVTYTAGAESENKLVDSFPGAEGVEEILILTVS